MPAWIRVDGGFSVRPCVVLGLSGAGVRLLVDERYTVAGQFNLLLKRDANWGRRCRITPGPRDQCRVFLKTAPLRDAWRPLNCAGPFELR
jgi:hypothetical protein